MALFSASPQNAVNNLTLNKQENVATIPPSAAALPAFLKQGTVAKWKAKEGLLFNDFLLGIEMVQRPLPLCTRRPHFRHFGRQERVHEY